MQNISQSFFEGLKQLKTIIKILPVTFTTNNTFYRNYQIITFRERMGLTEFEAVEKMYNGVAEMIQLEKELEQAEDVVASEIAEADAEVPAIEEVAEEAHTVGAAPEDEDEAVTEDVPAEEEAAEEDQHKNEL